MTLASFAGAHKDGEVICIGNGPSLDNVSVKFLRSRPSFGVNYIVEYNHLLDGFIPTYWIGLDWGSMDAISKLPPELPKFVPRRQHKSLQAKGIPTEGVVPFEMSDMEHPGSMSYGTTLLAAAHIASVCMEAKTVLLVGFDCARARRMVREGKGRTNGPHFYDKDHDAKPTAQWCNAFEILDIWLRKRGQRIINLSHPTYCNSLERGFFWDYV
jgi:hypothetical protein